MINYTITVDSNLVDKENNIAVVYMDNNPFNIQGSMFRFPTEDMLTKEEILTKLSGTKGITDIRGQFKGNTKDLTIPAQNMRSFFNEFEGMNIMEIGVNKDYVVFTAKDGVFTEFIKIDN